MYVTDKRPDRPTDRRARLEDP